MASPFRIEYSGVIYHVRAEQMNAKYVVRDDRDRQRLTDGLEAAVRRYGWELLSYVLMPHRIDALLRMPEPNLSRGLQQALGQRGRHTEMRSAAAWLAKRLMPTTLRELAAPRIDESEREM